MNHKTSLAWSWADKHIPAITDIMRNIFDFDIDVRDMSGEFEDLNEATDMIIYIGNDSGTVGLRIRHKEALKYRDITFRYSHPSGAKTEWEKLREDRLKWYFYGWSDENCGLEDWVFIDMKLAMVYLKDVMFEEGRIRTNKDGTKFVKFTISELNRLDDKIIRASRFNI